LFPKIIDAIVSNAVMMSPNILADSLGISEFLIALLTTIIKSIKQTVPTIIFETTSFSIIY